VEVAVERENPESSLRIFLCAENFLIGQPVLFPETSENRAIVLDYACIGRKPEKSLPVLRNMVNCLGEQSFRNTVMFQERIITGKSCIAESQREQKNVFC
jgi:hypothetical protein